MSSLRVFLDADVIFCGAAAPTSQGASFTILRLAEIRLIEAVTSVQALTEVERNLAEKLPRALPVFRLLVDRCLRVVPDPALEGLVAHAGAADPKDLPILVAALASRCPYLVTFNGRHFRPGDPAITVLRPGEFIQRLREWLARMESPPTGH